MQRQKMKHIQAVVENNNQKDNQFPSTNYQENICSVSQISLKIAQKSLRCQLKNYELQRIYSEQKTLKSCLKNQYLFIKNQCKSLKVPEPNDYYQDKQINQRFHRFDRQGIAISPGENYSVSIKKKPEILCHRKITGPDDKNSQKVTKKEIYFLKEITENQRNEKQKNQLVNSHKNLIQLKKVKSKGKKVEMQEITIEVQKQQPYISQIQENKSIQYSIEKQQRNYSEQVVNQKIPKKTNCCTIF